jgi:IS5 family transposase
MARRRIGQERLAVGSSAPRRSTSLDEISILVNWTELDGLLTGISASVKGEPGWPPLALLRALLLATWHDLSDVRLAEASMIEPASGGSAASLTMSQRRSAPPSSAFVRSWCVAGLAAPCSKLLPVSLINVVP